MNNARLAAIYYSTHGTNRVTAQTATEAARGTAAEARLLRVRETASPEVVKSQDAWATHADKTADTPVAGSDDMKWANAFLFSAPTRVDLGYLRCFWGAPSRGV